MVVDGRSAVSWCQAQPQAVEEFPFGPDTRVFKVGGRIFAIFPAGECPGRVSLKCDPGLAEVLRERHPGVTPGYHLNKRHWNTVDLGGSVPGEVVQDLLEHSYTLIVDGLPRRLREELREATASADLD
jgi:predicted DNA-binding protein (MmcQ/YjbR family)